MKSLCVFCGSSPGNNPAFIETAKALGYTMAEQNITLVYGGGNVGLMGVVADAVLEKGGKVTGVIPDFLKKKEVGHTGLTELIVVETMHQRKTKMFELSEGFIALPGGFGTLEEVIEILTWQQLGLHQYPVAFLNVDGFYNHLRSFFDEMERSKLLRSENKSMALFAETVPDLLEQMKNYRPLDVNKWMVKSKT